MRGATTHQCEAYPRIKVIISQFLRVIFCDDACASNVRFNKVQYITLFDKHEDSVHHDDKETP